MNFAAWFSSLVQPRRLPLRKAPRASLQLERLEDRAVPATHTWTGAGGDGNWSNSANWSGGAPTLTEGTNHDDPVKLVFGASSRKKDLQDQH